MPEILAIRHAESHYNAKLTDDLDSCLTEKGEEQARETAKYLARHSDLNEFIGIVSPYLRTLQTASIFKEYIDIDFEVDFGPVEVMITYENGSTIKDRREDFKNLIWPKDNFGTFHFHQENPNLYIGRMKAFYKSLLKNKKYMVISHGSPVKTLTDMNSNKNAVWSHEYPRNCSLNWTDGKSVISYDKIVY